MTALSVLETIISLTVQVTLLIAFIAWATRKRVAAAECDSCWASLHVCLLLLTAAAFFLPHLRLITWADLEPSESHPIAEAVCMVTGRICGWIWLTGAIAMIAVNVGGLLRGRCWFGVRESTKDCASR